MSRSPKVTALISEFREYLLKRGGPGTNEELTFLDQMEEALEAETPAVGWAGCTDDIHKDMDSKIPDLMRAFPNPSAQDIHAMMIHMGIWGSLHPCTKSTQPRDGITVTPEEWERMRALLKTQVIYHGDKVWEALALMQSIETRKGKD